MAVKVTDGLHSVRNRLQRIKIEPKVLQRIAESGVTRSSPSGRKILRNVGYEQCDDISKKMRRIKSPGKLSFDYGAKKETSLPKTTLPQVAFIGRSNVGKSHLINALSNSTLVRVRDQPGFTKAINFFKWGNAAYLVDTPGYGFGFGQAHVDGSLANFVKSYLKNGKKLRAICWCLDARQGLKMNDKDFMKDLGVLSASLIVVLTKCDLVKDTELAKKLVMIQNDLKLEGNSLHYVSSVRKAGLEALRKYMAYRLRI